MPLSRGSTYIHSMGHFHPENRLANRFFDQLDIESDAEWIEDRTGIKARHSVLAPENILRLGRGDCSLDDLRREGAVMGIDTMSREAWRCLEERYQAQFGKGPREQLDTVLCGTSVPDYDIPSNACFAAHGLGLRCTAFDVNSACSSFVVNLHVGRSLLQTEQSQGLLIVNPERYSLRMNYRERASCVLFGDGCTATILGREALPGSLEILDTLVVSDPSGYDLVKIPDGDVFSQNGKAVQKFAISKTIEATRAILDRNHMSPSDIQYFTGHQANLRMISSAAERLGLNPQKHLFNVDQYGNQGAAGAPAVLSQSWELFRPGDLIVVAVVGSGLTWGASLLRRV